MSKELSEELINKHLYDWQIQQHLNFSHHNELYIKPVPRESREAFGYSEPAPTATKAEIDPDYIVFGIGIILFVLACHFTV